MSTRRGGRANVANAADKQQVRDARKRQHREALDKDERLRTVMSTPIGRRFMWDDVLSPLGTFTSIYAPNGSNGAIHYNAGRQDIGHEWIAELTRVCPDAYLLMQREAIERDVAARPPVASEDEDETPTEEPDGN